MIRALAISELVAAAPAPTQLRAVARPSLRTPPQALAFVDVETTGLDPERHELLEIAVVRVDARSLEVLAEHHSLVAPERIWTAEAEALAVCGYSRAGWTHAPPLREALAAAAPLLEGALVAGHNVGFDWSFLEAGFRWAGLPIPRVDYHRLDTASLAWPLRLSGEIASISLDAVAAHLGLDRPRPHRALADARCALEVARRLSDRMRLGGRLAKLSGDERLIAELLLSRMELGRTQYGPWHVNDGRDYPSEAFEEVLDGLHYTAAELVKRQRERSSRRRRVYVCHPFAGDPAGNIERVRGISQRLLALGVLPVASHLYVPQLVDEDTDRDRALSLCLELLATCDEVRVFGDRVTAGMKLELAHAKDRGIPVRFESEVLS